MEARAFSLILLCGLVWSMSAQGVVVFTDANTEWAIRLELGKRSGDITADDLGSLTTLNLGGNELTSPTLPEGLSNLTDLHLWDTDLTSLTLPEGMSGYKTY
ncbi:MAG TPA: hypothetical protein EYQ50_02870 [Verrucomicrobiales bacterium]|jgi:hypothetical protein|nr:hypothetical protein [Verrucomicrobiales bacterium]HIL72510.1 hypothetical protein [Verrucomicrobiota bacterium]